MHDTSIRLSATFASREETIEELHGQCNNCLVEFTGSTIQTFLAVTLPEAQQKTPPQNLTTLLHVKHRHLNDSM